MSLEQLMSQISQQVDGVNERKIPPVELWNPPYCGEMDIRICDDGSWFYNGTVFKRMALVQLFASVLKREGDDYFLVTPVEKIKIFVDDAPFILTRWSWQDDNKQTISAMTNLGDSFTIDETHPLEIADNGSLYVTVRRNLKAKVHRNVYYQWVEMAQSREVEDGTEYFISSAGKQFTLGVA